LTLTCENAGTPVYLCHEGTGAISYWFDRERWDHCATYLPRHNPPPVGGVVLGRFPVAGMVTRQGGENCGPYLSAQVQRTMKGASA
jgi:hypothetical protein